MSNEPLTQVAVEREIFRISKNMEANLEKLTEYANSAAEAEVNFKVKFAQQMLKAAVDAGGKITVGDKDAKATVACEHELRRRLITEAHYETAREVLRTDRARLDGLRTISSNLRHMV